MKRAILLAALLAACAGPAGEAEERRAPAAPGTAPATATAAANASAAAAGSAAALAAGSAAAAGSVAAAGSAAAPAAGSAAALVPDAGADDASEAAPPYAADNKILPPRESAELTERARGLFEAIVKNEPALGEPFWFPKEPFIPLKDVKGPDKYWDNLHRTFVNDVRSLHRKRKSWDGARFVGFELGSTPKWVPPGDEVNKIGYYRTFRGKIRYEIDGKQSSLDVHVMISWQGRWYITHLKRFKKK